jgi:hypothetical protein
MWIGPLEVTRNPVKTCKSDTANGIFYGTYVICNTFAVLTEISAAVSLNIRSRLSISPAYPGAV